MKWVTQRPAGMIKVFFLGKRNRREEKKVVGKMGLSLQINITRLLQRGENSLDSTVLKNKIGSTVVKF